MTTIDIVTLARVTGGNLSSEQRKPPGDLLPRPDLGCKPLPLPLPRPNPFPGFNPKYPPGSLDLPRRNDIA